MTITEDFTTKEKKLYLSSFDKVKPTLFYNDKAIPTGSFIAYVSKDTKELHLGGVLTRVDHDGSYIYLVNGNKSWSVNINEHIFYIKREINDSHHMLEFEDLNNALKFYGSDPIIMNDLENIEEFIEFIDLPKINISRKEIREIQKKYDIKDSTYISTPDLYDSLDVGDYIKYYDKETNKISTSARITKWKKENGRIRNYTLYSRYNNKDVIWKIRPQDFIIFKLKNLDNFKDELKDIIDLSKKSKNKIIVEKVVRK